MKKELILLFGAAMMMTGCSGENQNGNQNNQQDDGKMQYIKTSVLYDTLMDMYTNPDNYLGKTYHMVGRLYPSESDGEKFYSIYADGTGGKEGIGLELDWSDFSAFKDNETITVEGKVERETGTHDGKEFTYLVLRVSKIEKRE